MTKLSFEEPKNREQALADFKGLLENTGWKLLETVVNENMEVIRNQILEGVGEGETIENISRLRDKLRAYKDIIGTPVKMIEYLTPADPPTHNEDDPYPFVEPKPKNKV